MKALITGGVGFIGQHLARHFTPAWEVVALDNLLPQVHQDPASAVEAFPGDVHLGEVTDRKAWERLARPDVVIHLAAETGTAQSMYAAEHHRHVNIGGTQLAGEFAAAWGVPLIAMSSRAVYGEGRYRTRAGTTYVGARRDSTDTPAASGEDDAHAPTSVYGETKSEGEARVAAFASQIPVGILRPQNVIGAGQALHNPYTGVLAAFVARLREGLPLLIYGPGTQTRDFVAVSDVVATLGWMARHLLDSPHAAMPSTLNSGSGLRTTLLDLAHHAMAASPNGPVEIEHVAVKRAGDIEHACADLTRTRTWSAPLATQTTAAAVAEFVNWSWDRSMAKPTAWDHALTELADRGLVE